MTIKHSESLKLHNFPADISAVFTNLNVPQRLYNHCVVVYETAQSLHKQIMQVWPNLNVDWEIVMFGAATHDIGKCIYQNELTASGHCHEMAGFRLLCDMGVNEDKAKFAATHASWTEHSSLEELLVSLADNIWRGSRIAELEKLAVAKIASAVGQEHWEVFLKLDDILSGIAKNADKRLIL